MFSQLTAWLAAAHPALPWALLTVVLWLIQYIVRKVAPNAWEFLADLPFPAELGPALLLARKAWQALPGTLAGALMGAFASGGDYRAAALGALAGVAASLKHELLKALPFVPYRGEVGRGNDEPPTGQKPVGLASMVLALTLLGCAPSGLADPCSEESLAAITAECKLRITRECPDITETACPPDEPCPQCPALSECDRRIDSWKGCR